MVSLGVQIAFFFILFRNLAISYSVKRIHGACSLPGFASGGGAGSRDNALLVDMPATWLCTFVPMPGSLGGRGPRSFGILGGFGAFSRIGFPFLRDPPTRDVGIGRGEGGIDSQSDAVKEVGESGFGGGSTSPGIVIRFLRSLTF